MGWKISEVNRTRGGFSGYDSLNVMRSWNMPPCVAQLAHNGYGVSAGASGSGKRQQHGFRLRAPLRAARTSHGVSDGPRIVAPHTYRLSSLSGEALQPEGGSCCTGRAGGRVVVGGGGGERYLCRAVHPRGELGAHLRHSL